MDWQSTLRAHLNERQWDAALDLLTAEQIKRPRDARVAANRIFVPFQILLYEDAHAAARDSYERILRESFSATYSTFQSDAGYLFFVSYLMAVAEWLFGETDLRRADAMRARAAALEPDNALYQWGVRLSAPTAQSEAETSVLRSEASTLLKTSPALREWARSWGPVADYVVDAL